MHSLQGTEICNPFMGSTRPHLLRRGSLYSTVSSFCHTSQQHTLIGNFCPQAGRRTVSVTVQAQSGPAADNNAQASPPVLKQSLSQPAVNETTAEQKPVAAKLGTLWGLLVLSIAYVHHSTCGYVCHAAMPRCQHLLLATSNASLDRRFALPALLPLITPDLHLTEQQGALLTAGYAVSAPRCATLSALSILYEIDLAVHNHTCSMSFAAFWQALNYVWCACSSGHCMMVSLYPVSPSNRCVVPVSVRICCI